MLAEYSGDIVTKRSNDYLNPFAPGEFHGRNEVGITGKQHYPVYDTLTREPRNIQADFNINPFLL